MKRDVYICRKDTPINHISTSAHPSVCIYYHAWANRASSKATRLFRMEVIKATSIKYAEHVTTQLCTRKETCQNTVMHKKRNMHTQSNMPNTSKHSYAHEKKHAETQLCIQKETCIRNLSPKQICRTCQNTIIHTDRNMHTPFIHIHISTITENVKRDLSIWKHTQMRLISNRPVYMKRDK